MVSLPSSLGSISKMRKVVLFFLLFAHLFPGDAAAQTGAVAEVRGSMTAKGGFRNEDEIRDKFNNWRADADARAWLETMGFAAGSILGVSAEKPHGDKADVIVNVRTNKGESKQGISIKLVSSPTGFNQVDKRWLRQYAAMWGMPANVVKALRLFSGEERPVGRSRRPDRMFLNEFDKDTQAQVVGFFEANRSAIIADLIEGDGENKAAWFMVAMKGQNKTQWILRPVSEAIGFFGGGNVEITRSGNLRIGRITMQRKGGDGGRETAKMLQFKLNPALLFEAK